jgi:hypothetical protein
MTINLKVKLSNFIQLFKLEILKRYLIKDLKRTLNYIRILKNYFIKSDFRKFSILDIRVWTELLSIVLKILGTQKSSSVDDF